MRAAPLMKALVACTTALLLSGCVSWPQPFATKPFSDAVAAEIPSFGEVEFTLKDGRVERVKNVGDHGYAMCGEWACFRKADIVSAGYRAEKTDPVRTAVAIPLVAPALVVLGAICTMNCDLYGTPYKPTGKEPVATPQMLERRWLDALRIENGKVMPHNYLGPNPCVGDAPTAVGRDFATDGEAFDWIVANRNTVSRECLDRVLLGASSGSGPDDAARTRQGRLLVAATYAVRWKWNIARCVMTDQNGYLEKLARERITPLRNMSAATSAAIQTRYSLSNRRWPILRPMSTKATSRATAPMASCPATSGQTSPPGAPPARPSPRSRT